MIYYDCPGIFIIFSSMFQGNLHKINLFLGGAPNPKR